MRPATALQALLVLALLIAGVYFLGRLLNLVAGGTVVVARARANGRALLRAHVRSLSTEALRREQLAHEYLAALNGVPSVRELLQRIARHEESLVVRELSRHGLYAMLCDAERAIGWPGRPIAVDTTGQIYAMLEELDRRNRAS